MRGYTVIDVETTGFSYKRGHRIVELGVVEVSPTGEIEQTWETLINPQRHIAASEIHGITASDVFGAPTFAEVADKLVASLEDRVFVAHNASFDNQFIGEELVHCGRCESSSFPVIDTMKLARTYLGLQQFRLADCCEYLGIRNEKAHSALSDALVTAQLLQYFLRSTPALREDYFREQITALEQFSGFSPSGESEAPLLLSRLNAREARAAAQNGGWFQGLVDGRKTPTSNMAADYFQLLDAAFLDRQLSVTEQSQLLNFARNNELSSEVLHNLHENYITQLIEKAWEDGVVTPDEQDILLAVARGLGLSEDELEAALSNDGGNSAAKHSTGTDRATSNGEGPVSTQALGGITLNPGDRVTVTGAKKFSNSEWADYLSAHGVELGGLAKKTKVLIAADPDSQSGKAKKAKSYGIPVISEDVARDVLRFVQ